MVISADKEIKKVDGGWYVPDARMKEIMEQLNDKVLQLEKEPKK